MSLDSSQVEQIAHLARLGIDAEDVPQYAQSLSAILDLVDQMQALDTEHLVPMANPHDATQRLRPDAVTETNQRDLFQAQAPAVEQGLFLVPRVID